MIKAMLFRLSLQKKILSIGIGLPAMIIAALLLMYSQEASSRAIESSVDKARSICLTADSAREQTEKQWASEIFSHAQLREWSENGKEANVMSTIPIITAWETAMAKSEQGGYEFRVPALEPRNPDNAPDPIQKEALLALRDSDIDEYVKVDYEKNRVHYFRPVRLGKSCLSCHGDPSLSEELWGRSDGMDITGHRMENWELGRMHGAFEVVQSLEEANAAASSSVLWACLIAAFSLGISALITVFTLKSVKSRILDTSSAIGSSVTGLKGASRILTDDAHETLSKTSEMATSVSETTQNISIVTDAMNEMGNAIEEIAQRSSEASQIANTAVEKAAAAVKVLSQLGECSSRIENVVGVINTLAEQTNLLALNATIEAARAGESGKGFAVVASEVKELANQTTVATEDIAKVVSAIREATKTAVKCVDDVDAVITDINGLQSAIAAAVEEQSVTTREVGRNLDGISAASADLSRHIETVTMSANRTNARVEESVTMIADISRAANDVPRLVGVEINDSFQTVTTTTA